MGTKWVQTQYVGEHYGYKRNLYGTFWVQKQNLGTKQKSL